VTAPGSDREAFTFGVWTWDVNAALDEADPEVHTVLVSDVASILGLIRVDREHAKTADLSKPILLARFPDVDAWLPIDGWHRIARAVDEGVETLPAQFTEARPLSPRRPA
jgi:hypothetical protein